ncbi:phytanoyl-CoA dioxygenase family protein [Chloroflexi bacterium TSY]|nr:phytanoyl-CoA dioxygenase family protein [Chloroflexi bacterium TSY]
MQITQSQIDQFHSEGYFILENAITQEQLDGLRSECQRYIDKYEAEMEAKGVTTLGINHYKKRYFIARRAHESPIIWDFLFSDLMIDITSATLGNDVYLFHEQYVVKAAEVGTKFGWHQDSGYVGHYHRPYLSCWCALDDMSEANGTISVLPYSRAGMTADDLFDHTVEEGSNDKVGYHGDDPGVLAVIPAGGIVVFSSRTFHRSGPNITDKMRRCYLTQYSAEPIMNREGTAPWGQAVPLLKDGERVVAPNRMEQPEWAPPERR